MKVPVGPTPAERQKKLAEAQERSIELGGPVFNHLLRAAHSEKDCTIVNFGALRCRRCRARRTMDLVWHGRTLDFATSARGATVKFLPPGLGTFQCRQCSEPHHAGLWFDAYGDFDSEVKIALIDLHVSIATDNTPPAVAYYLDQAAASKSAHALSAAAAMLRVALELILHERQFAGSVKAQIDALEKMRGQPAAPAWAMSLDATELGLLREIGNGAAHANGGEIERQEAITEQVIEQIEAVLGHMLEVFYEEPQKASRRFAILDKAGAEVTPARTPTK